jgi:pyruvate formate lyase activating enzyme
MTTGIVFDIKEFAVHDGPGIRTTVFLKGCPLACAWCHNPEGQSSEPQTMHSPAGTRVAGRYFTPSELAARLNAQAGILKMNEGGVTFSGGEPLQQAAFVAEVISLLDDLHVLIETSGYGSAGRLRLLLVHTNLVFYDVKLIDPQAHLHYTGRTNELILRNLQLVSASDVPFVIRVPLVPGVTDTDENLAGIARLAQGLPGLLRVDLLSYNRAAGAKYQAAGMQFKPDYDETRPLNLNMRIFEQAGVPVCVA